MKLRHLNLLTAVVSLCASLAWFAAGQNATGLAWLAGSLVWLALSIYRLRSPSTEPEPIARMARRLSRMLLWS